MSSIYVMYVDCAAVAAVGGSVARVSRVVMTGLCDDGSLW